MDGSNKMKSGGLAILGRVVGSALSGTAALAITWLILVVAGIFRVTTIQVLTMQSYDPVRRSFHIFGHVFEQGDFPFRLFCALFLLPSVAAAFLVWVHLGRRWRTRKR
jgi:hypothetical protein